MTEIARVRYTHDAMIDLIIAQPEISQNEIASAFGYTPTWISIIMNSDAFQERLAERKGEIVDPILRATITDRLQAVAAKSAEKLLEKLETGTVKPGEIVRAMEVATKALGYGAKIDTQINNTQYVAVVPQRSNNSAEWAEAYGRNPAPAVLPAALTPKQDAVEVQFTDEGGVGDAISG